MTATFGEFLTLAGYHIAGAVAFRGELPGGWTTSPQPSALRAPFLVSAAGSPDSMKTNVSAQETTPPQS